MSGRGKREVRPGIAAQVTPELVAAVQAKAKDGRVTCPVLRKLADDLGVAPAVIGHAADQAGVKVHNCELGCF